MQQIHVSCILNLYNNIINHFMLMLAIHTFVSAYVNICKKNGKLIPVCTNEQIILPIFWFFFCWYFSNIFFTHESWSISLVRTFIKLWALERKWAIDRIRESPQKSLNCRSNILSWFKEIVQAWLTVKKSFFKYLLPSLIPTNENFI